MSSVERVTGMNREDLLQELEGLRRRVAELEGNEFRLKDSQRANRECEEQIRLSYDNVPLPYQSLDMHGCFLEINQAWLDTLGYFREEVLGKWFGDFLAPDCRERFTVDFPKFDVAGEWHWLKFEMLRKDGSQVPVALDGKLERDGRARFSRVHCTVRDISEIKQSQDTLEVLMQRYKAVFNNIEVGISVLNSDMEIVEVNKAFEDYFPHVRPAYGQICYEHYNNPPRSEPCPYCPCVLTLRDGGGGHGDSGRFGNQELSHRFVSNQGFGRSDTIRHRDDRGHH